MSQYVTLEFKRGTASNWTTTNPTLAPGEPGFELDTGNMKIGTGATGWNNLPYVTAKTNPLTNSVSLGVQTTGQGNNAVAIGGLSGQSNQGTNSVAIGLKAGELSQGYSSVNDGNLTGVTGYSIAIGFRAGQGLQRDESIAIGSFAGGASQKNNSIAIGQSAGYVSQGSNSIAIGTDAAYQNQGSNSIAIGKKAGMGPTNPQASNTIILNASGLEVDGVSGVSGAFYVRPIRQDLTKTVPLMYDPLTYEIVQGPTGPTGYNFSVPLNSILWTPDGTSVTGTTGLQYASGVGVTMDKINIQSFAYPGTVSIGYASGKGGQGEYSVAIGQSSGQGQGQSTVAIGYSAGFTAQGDFCVAVGNNAGITGQKERAVAIGQSAGNTIQGTNSVAVGDSAGYTGQGDYSVAVGPGAGYIRQGQFSVAIGSRAGDTDQGANSVAIGSLAGDSGQADNTIILNASGSALNGNVGVTGCFYVKPIRTDLTQTTPLCYNSTSGEIVMGSRTTTGSWTLSAVTGFVNRVSFTVPLGGTYSIWVRGNIPNGIVSYTATVVVSNPNVPVVGSSYGWWYTAGNMLEFRSIPTQIVGTLNQISTDPILNLSTSNEFVFDIINRSGVSQVVYWGYTTL